MLRVRIPSLVPVTALWVARERARGGDRDAAITMMRDAVDELYEDGRLGYCLAGMRDSGGGADRAGRRRRLGLRPKRRSIASPNMKAGDVWAIREVTLLRLRALLARARADPAYRELVRRYRAMAESHGYDGHIAWAQAMDEGER